MKLKLSMILNSLKGFNIIVDNNDTNFDYAVIIVLIDLIKMNMPFR